MAIIESYIVESDGQQFNRLTSVNAYWGVAYTDALLIVALTVPDPDIPNGGAISGGTYTDGVYKGFGADTYEELEAEIQARGLIYPNL